MVRGNMVRAKSFRRSEQKKGKKLECYRSKNERTVWYKQNKDFFFGPFPPWHSVPRQVHTCHFCENSQSAARREMV